MKTQFHESADLLHMLLFTVKVIATSEPGDKQRIANAYQDARLWRRSAWTMKVQHGHVSLPVSSVSMPTRPPMMLRRPAGY